MLWITRDDKGKECEAGGYGLWHTPTSTRPKKDNGEWIEDYYPFNGCGILKTFFECPAGNVPPGTCTRLYTQSEVRYLTARASIAGYYGGSKGIAGVAEAYLNHPCEAAWAPLARAIGLTGETE